MQLVCEAGKTRALSENSTFGSVEMLPNAVRIAELAIAKQAINADCRSSSAKQATGRAVGED